MFPCDVKASMLEYNDKLATSRGEVQGQIKIAINISVFVINTMPPKEGTCMERVNS